jgi:hypothetical protein
MALAANCNHAQRRTAFENIPGQKLLKKNAPLQLHPCPVRCPESLVYVSIRNYRSQFTLDIFSVKIGHLSHTFRNPVSANDDEGSRR